MRKLGNIGPIKNSFSRQKSWFSKGGVCSLSQPRYWIIISCKSIIYRDFLSVILSKALIMLFTFKSACSSYSWKILDDGIFARAGIWILFAETLDTDFKDFVNRVLFTLKLLFKLVDTNKSSKAWLPIFSINKSYPK